MRSRAAVGFALLAVLSLTGCADEGSSASQAPVADVSTPDDGMRGIVLPQPYVAPAVALEGTSGKPYDLATDATKPLTLVFFGYTHCPDVCQVVMANIASALVRLDDDQRSQVGMVFVTTDPTRDTPTALRAYLDRFDPSFEGATGDLRRILRVADAFGVEVEKGRKLATGGFEIAHGAQVVGLRPDGTAPFVWTDSTDPGVLAADIPTILDDKVPGL